MSIPEILTQIDAEIARLKQVRNILADETSAPKPKAKRRLSAEARSRLCSQRVSSDAVREDAR
jgi:hypothetical protein